MLAVRSLSTALPLLAAFASAAGAPAAEAVPPGVLPGQTLTFCGDSITHQRGYTDYVSLFYLTRYPEAPIRVFNAGVGGNTAAGALPRFRQDIRDPKPAVVALAFGMDELDCNHPVAPAEIRIVLNGKTVWEGPVKFSKKTWSRREIELPADVLRPGANTLEIVNVSAPDSIANWYERWTMISQVVLRWAPAAPQE